jgi:hydrogenase nickel incorporation protein HypB
MCNDCGCLEPGHEHHTHSHETTTLAIHQDVLTKNNALAEQNRTIFASRGVFAINLISSPGSGKTALLEALARHYGPTMAVIEGDIQTSRDADRVIRSGSRAHQIETRGACHLDAHAVLHALDHLDLSGCRLLVIENVGNLVCPAAYDLGEHEKMAILSLPEGDDKILKYPALFSRIDALIINKMDLMPYLDFCVDTAVSECRSLNRSFETFLLSAKTGEGLDRLISHLDLRIRSLR